MKYDVWALINNEATLYPCANRDHGNTVFIELKKLGYPVATDNGTRIKFWNCEDIDWMDYFINNGNEYCDWNKRDSFGLRVLSTWEELTVLHNNDSCILPLHGKKYKITKEFCKEDEQLADLYGSKDKYYKYTFWDMNGKELSSYCLEA